MGDVTPVYGHEARQRSIEVFRRELDDENAHIEDAVHAAVFAALSDQAAEVERLRARLALLTRRSHPMDFDSPAYD